MKNIHRLPIWTCASTRTLKLENFIAATIMHSSFLNSHKPFLTNRYLHQLHFAPQLTIWIWSSRNLIIRGPSIILECWLLSKCDKKILWNCCIIKNHVQLRGFKKSLAPLCKRSLQIITPPQRGDWYSLRRLFIHSIQQCNNWNNNGTTGLIS